MISTFDHVRQLEAELKNSASRRERAMIKAELAKAIADQASLDREFDQAFEAFIEEGK